MIRIIGLNILCIIFFPVLVLGSATATWKASPESDLAGYKVYSGSTSGNYSNVVDVGLQTFHVFLDVKDNVPLFINVTAYDTSGNEGLFGKEVKYMRDTTPPIAVGGLRITKIEVIKNPLVEVKDVDGSGNVPGYLEGAN